MTSRQLDRGLVFGLTAQDLGLIVFTRKAILGWWRDQGVEPPGLRGLLDEMAAVASLSKAISDPASNSLPIVDESAAPAARLRWTSTGSASKRLGISQRRVVQLLQSGQLAGRQDGPNSTWQVDDQSVTEYLARSAVTRRP